jgi:hypothetical protein
MENNLSNEGDKEPVVHLDFKSKKNRDSAKCSRQRKKIYIDLLEKKVLLFFIFF